MAFDTRVHYRDPKSGKIEPEKSQPYQKKVRAQNGSITETYIRDGVSYYANGEKIEAAPEPPKGNPPKPSKKERARLLAEAKVPAKSADKIPVAEQEANKVTADKQAEDAFGAASAQWGENSSSSDGASA